MKTREEMINERNRELPLKWFDLVTRDGELQHQLKGKGLGEIWSDAIPEHEAK